MIISRSAPIVRKQSPRCPETTTLIDADLGQPEILASIGKSNASRTSASGFVRDLLTQTHSRRVVRAPARPTDMTWWASLALEPPSVLQTPKYWLRFSNNRRRLRANPPIRSSEHSEPVPATTIPPLGYGVLNRKALGDWLRLVERVIEEIGFVLENPKRVTPPVGQGSPCRFSYLVRWPIDPDENGRASLALRESKKPPGRDVEIRARRLASFCLFLSVGLLIALMAGCDGRNQDALIVATTWNAVSRLDLETRAKISVPVEWIVLEPGSRLADVVDRRGGVDAILGGPAVNLASLQEAGKLVTVENSNRNSQLIIEQPVPPSGNDSNPNIPAVDRLRALGWPRGFEELVREPRPAPQLHSSNIEPNGTGFVLVQGGRHPNEARALARVLGSRATTIDPTLEGLTLDYLQSSLIDAWDERRDALKALERFHHPANAEALLSERAPWPPASVGLLLNDPEGGELLETLLEQLAPQPESRAWLQDSWSGEGRRVRSADRGLGFRNEIIRPDSATEPSVRGADPTGRELRVYPPVGLVRRVDGELLAEIAEADGGRLSREPRLRAWLRSEWRAWHRQLYRRVARLAGGLDPS